MTNYRELLVRSSQEVEEAPRALSPTQLRNKQSREAWRERWARHHGEQELPALMLRQAGHI